jgi:hypothetical protein
MTEMGSAGTLGGLLASRRRCRFVGRASEIQLLWAALDSAEPPCSMLHDLRGPGGVGETRLRDGLAGLAADTDASVRDDRRGTGRRADAIDLLGTLARF